jgi:LysM repeat protein
VSVNDLASANRIANINQIYVGQVLVMPGAPAPASQLYTVVPGDTLAKIAARFGTTVAALQTANNLRNINLIYTGQVLRIP